MGLFTLLTALGVNDVVLGSLGGHCRALILEFLRF